MPDTLSNKLIAALDVPRDRLFSRALASETTPAKAELRLQRTVRELFPRFAADPFMDVPAAIEQTLAAASPAEETAMPADVWARLVAAIQVEAARSNNTKAINPDSVLLSPDPLLVPKKSVQADDDDFSQPSRFLFVAGMVVLLGIALTIYILTRPSGPHATTLPTAPATTTAMQP